MFAGIYPDEDVHRPGQEVERSCGARNITTRFSLDVDSGIRQRACIISTLPLLRRWRRIVRLEMIEKPEYIHELTYVNERVFESSGRCEAVR